MAFELVHDFLFESLVDLPSAFPFIDGVCMVLYRLVNPLAHILNSPRFHHHIGLVGLNRPAVLEVLDERRLLRSELVLVPAMEQSASIVVKHIDFVLDLLESVSHLHHGPFAPDLQIYFIVDF